MVSEVMLQQTQAPRVVPKYKEFIAAFPTIRKLANAKLSDVLRLWSGLGYNRRAKYLHDAAKTIVCEHEGRMPKIAEEFEKLPGIGHYTARAICAFAYDSPSVFLETNIRTAFIHYFFSAAPHPLTPHDREGLVGGGDKVDDGELLPIIERTMMAAERKEGARVWYSALMDYGVYIKATEGNASRRSSSYKKQSEFAGSLRQTRGEILRALHEESKTLAALKRTVSRPKHLGTALNGLKRDGLVVYQRKWQLV